MNEFLTPGRVWQRIAFGLLLPLFLWSAYSWWSGALHGAFVLLLGFAAFMTGVLSSERVFARWVAFGEKLNRVVVILIFGAIYFIVVPFFQFARLRDRLAVRGLAKRASFWRERPITHDVLERLERMG